MRLWDHRNRFAPEVFTALAEEVNTLNKTLTSHGTSLAVPTVARQATQHKIWMPEHWESGHALGQHAYVLKRGSVPTWGLSHGISQQLWDAAMIDRYSSALYIWDEGHPELVDGYGYVDRRNNQVSDYTLAGHDDARWTRGQSHYEIYYNDRETFHAGSWRITGDAILNHTATEFTEALWNSTYAGDLPCPDAPEYARWRGWSDSPTLDYYTGPWWKCGTVGSGVYDQPPFASWNATFGAGNSIGGVLDPDTDTWFLQDETRRAEFRVSGGASWGYPRIKQRIPSGSRINQTLLEIQVQGLSRYERTITRTVNGAGEISAEVSYNTDVQDMTLTLVGGKVVGTRWQYDVLATQAAAISGSDLWQVVDITDMCQWMISSDRDSAYSRYAIVPAQYAGMAGGVVSKDYVKALLPTVTWDVWLASAPSTDWFAYRPSEHGVIVTFTDVVLGQVYVDWTLPDGEQHREKMPWHLPPMH